MRERGLVDTALTRASRRLQKKTATAAPLALSLDKGEGSGIGQGEGEREVQTAKRELCKGLLDRERDHRKEAEGRIIQWRKWRTPVKTIARPCWSAAAITSSSRAEPPGCAIAVAPASAASVGPSGNGKKAS